MKHQREVIHCIPKMYIEMMYQSCFFLFLLEHANTTSTTSNLTFQDKSKNTCRCNEHHFQQE
jgi:hypothetical protein